MTGAVAASPLPFVRSEADGLGALAAEDHFWRGLSCRFADTTIQPAPGTSRWLLRAGIELSIPANVGCSWLRVEMRLDDGWRAIDVFPRLVGEPSGVTGAALVSPDGRLERDLVPGGGDLPAFMCGWATTDGTAVWDVLPRTGAVPERIEELMILSEGGSAKPTVISHRVVLALRSPGLGRRLALFTGETSTQEVADMANEQDAVGGFIEPVLVAEPAEAADALLDRLRRADRWFGVLVEGDEVVGVVDRKRLEMYKRTHRRQHRKSH